MKMEILAVQQQYQSNYNICGSSKVRDWTSTLTPLMPLSTCAFLDENEEVPMVTVTASIPIPHLQNNNNNIINNNNNNSNTVNNKNLKNSIMHNKKTKRTASTDELLVPEVISPPLSTQSQTQMQSNSYSSSLAGKVPATRSASAPTVGGSYLTTNHTPQNGSSASTNLFYSDDVDAAAVNELSLRILDELRAAKSRHLTCTEVSLPCDLTPRIAAEIIRVSEKEPCGIRGCTIYIEFEDEPNNSRRIAELKLDAEMVSTFEVYLTLRQDRSGWKSLLPQFMKSLARTITISPSFTITKHKLYSADRSSYSYGSSTAISTPTS